MSPWLQGMGNPSSANQEVARGESISAQSLLHRRCIASSHSSTASAQTHRSISSGALTWAVLRQNQSRLWLVWNSKDASFSIGMHTYIPGQNSFEENHVCENSANRSRRFAWTMLHSECMKSWYIQCCLMLSNSMIKSGRCSTLSVQDIVEKQETSMQFANHLNLQWCRRV